MKKPPDVYCAFKPDPLITTQNWLDLMEWAKNRDEYLYYRALSSLLKLEPTIEINK